VAEHGDWTAPEARQALAEAVRGAVKPVNNTALPPRYRKAMVSVLASRALGDLLKGA